MKRLPVPCPEKPSAGVGQPNASAWVIVGTVLGSSMEFIDGTVVNVALPSLQRSFGATGTQVQWVVEAYSLLLASLLLAGGSMGDRFGLRKVFLAGIVLFAGASVWCGVAPTLSQLLAARCLQGMGGALLAPNSLALLSASFSGDKQGKAIGTWSGFAAMMTAVGPVVGGWMVQHGSWRWVFFLNVPIALAAVGITLWRIKPVSVTVERKAFDWGGAVLGTAGLTAITFSLMQWAGSDFRIKILGAVGMLLLGGFVYVESKVVAPMMPLELFRYRTFTGANLLTFFLYASLAGALFYLPLNLIQIQGYSPTQAGASMLPLVLVMFVLSRWAGGLVSRYGSKLPLVVGPLVTAAGYGLLARPGVGGPYWETYLPAMLLLGLGMTISVAPLTTVVMSSAGESRGAASGINNTVSQTAALLALAVSAPLFFGRFSGELPDRLVAAKASPVVVQRVEGEVLRLGAIETEDAGGRGAVDQAFVGAFRLIVVLAALSAAAAGGTAAVMVKDERRA